MNFHREFSKLEIVISVGRCIFGTRQGVAGTCLLGQSAGIRSGARAGTAEFSDSAAGAWSSGIAQSCTGEAFKIIEKGNNAKEKKSTDPAARLIFFVRLCIYIARRTAKYFLHT